MKVKKSNLMLAVYIILAAASIITILVFTLGRKDKEEVLKVGFITSGSVEDRGWNSVNYRCIKEACGNLGAELIAIDNIDGYGGHCKFAVEELANSGVKLIILNSSVLSEQMKDLLRNYPDIMFYGANADFEELNFSGFSSRMYQVRYLSGIVAGLYTKTNKIGFVAGYKEASAYQGINAFTLGVRSVNPDAEVIVAWSGVLDNESRETSLARALIEEENVDLLTYYQTTPHVVDTAEKHNIASIGYYDPVENASDKYLTCALCNWTPIYEQMLRSCMNGQSKAVDTDWVGIETGAMKLTVFSPLVPAEAVDRVNRSEQAMINGLHVFSGDIYDTNGVKQCSEGEFISDHTLLYEMDWLTEGVREYAE